MARMLTDVMEREAYEDALDPVPDDDLPSSDIDDLDDHNIDEPDDDFEDAAALVPPDPDEDDVDTFDADGEPLPDDVQAEIEAIAAEGLAADEPPDEMPDAPSEAPPETAAATLATSPEATRTLVLEQALEAAQRELARQRDLACAAVARYRQAVLAAEPDLPPEMVHGENIEDVDASIAAARTMVAHVREQVEARRPSERGFPAGAPARDTSARGHLTARQKIAAGLQERLM